MMKMVSEMTQMVNSYSQSIAKLEAQVGQMTNTLNRRKEGKLPSQPMVNPKGHYMVEEGTSHHKQVQAIITLGIRSLIKNHVKKKNEETEAS
jgi:uncharacterized coiled-coil protein SlyX